MDDAETAMWHSMHYHLLTGVSGQDKAPKSGFTGQYSM